MFRFIYYKLVDIFSNIKNLVVGFLVERIRLDFLGNDCLSPDGKLRERDKMNIIVGQIGDL